MKVKDAYGEGKSGVYYGTMNCVYLELWRYASKLTKQQLAAIKNNFGKEIDRVIKNGRGAADSLLQNKLERAGLTPACAHEVASGKINNKPLYSIQHTLFDECRSIDNLEMPLFFTDGDAEFAEDTKLKIRLNDAFIEAVLSLAKSGNKKAKALKRAIT